MPLHLEYHPQMRYGTLVLAVFLVASFSLSASAQANGVPPSVTSYGFGGQPGFHGTPPSVTSLGPHGATSSHPVHPHPFQPQAGGQPGHHHHNGGNQNYYPYYVPYYIPYYPTMDYEGPTSDDSAAVQDPPDTYEGGPTIFDRLGSGARAANDYVVEKPKAAVPRPPAPLAAASDDPPPTAQVPDPPATPQPVSALLPTILIFKDGHKQQIGNYAIVGSNLYDLTPGRRQKVALADLDLDATQKANDDEGNDFRLPQLPDGN